MTRKQDSAKRTDWTELMAGQEDFLLVQEVVRQVLEAEMEEAVGAEKGRRTPKRQGYALARGSQYNVQSGGHGSSEEHLEEKRGFRNSGESAVVASLQTAMSCKT